MKTLQNIKHIPIIDEHRQHKHHKQKIQQIAATEKYVTTNALKYAYGHQKLYKKKTQQHHNNNIFLMNNK